MKNYNFFDINLKKFVKYVKLKRDENIYIKINHSNIDELFDFYDFYYQFYYNKLIQKKILNNKISYGSPFRNLTLFKSQETVYDIR